MQDRKTLLLDILRFNERIETSFWLGYYCFKINRGSKIITVVHSIFIITKGNGL